ncbi:acyltransferase family protein [Escherichia sp. E2593]|uniref:acyltransferase family protein n=1 Tax=Escherichia sp. E2593 TaxID=2044458 RepID=UPI003464D464
MNPVPAQREYFLDSIRAWLMLLGIPFHISLIYSSHTWHVNSAEPSWWLTLFNDFIHSFRMQVFFVISGYFSYMLFLRYPLKKMVESSCRTRRDPDVNGHSSADLAAIHYAAVCQRQSRKLAWPVIV